MASVLTETVIFSNMSNYFVVQCKIFEDLGLVVASAAPPLDRINSQISAGSTICSGFFWVAQRTFHDGVSENVNTVRNGCN